MPEMGDPLAGLRECQLHCLPRFAEGTAEVGPQPFVKRLKRKFASPWNHCVKKWLKRFTRWSAGWSSRFTATADPTTTPVVNSTTAHLNVGDWVLVRPREEIEATLDRWKEQKGCAFLEYMWQYCGTTQQVLQPMERFLDERDYKVKKVKGVVLLKDILCKGTPVFGRCDRCCHLFWREEWLERIETP
ncbi:MAG: hypothetical protein A2W35_05970 [Chloroflexi bacterium RBG_16_57_11]|nr:MAG: hypothetical protein A2W35_05970 [Chloroflexi bacterium RBG_16_57_11]